MTRASEKLVARLRLLVAKAENAYARAYRANEESYRVADRLIDLRAMQLALDCAESRLREQQAAGAS